MRILYSGLALLTFLSCAFSQTNFGSSPFRNAIIYVDTATYSWQDNRVTQGGKAALAFQYTLHDETAEIYLDFPPYSKPEYLELVPSSDFTVLDSLVMFKDYARFKVQFSNLNRASFLKFIFKTGKDSLAGEAIELPLLPHTSTYAELYPPSDDLYIGEEKVIEITTNNVHNFVIDNRWTEGLPINYRTTKSSGKLYLHLLPSELGHQPLTLSLSLKRPNVIDGNLEYELPEITKYFQIKSGRLAFLQFDLTEVTPSDNRTDPIELQLDNHYLLKLNKTYRIEAQEKSGGALIAEIYTKNRLNNDKVLCLLRPYAFHHKSEGYLYIKDGDDPKFVTNLDITPKTKIQKISIQREGKDWEVSNEVHPGETVHIRLEGEGLHKANFTFPGANNLEYDSLVKNENTSLFQLKVPMNISANRIDIYNHNQPTGKFLKIDEYQRARPLDFITLDLGDQYYRLDKIDKPIYHESVLTDLVFNFDRSMIDAGPEPFGKQYLSISVKISSKKGNLIEINEINEYVVCPDESSPRFLYYNSKDCNLEDININDYIRKKTSELEEWSRIQIEISHIKNKYDGSGQSKKLMIYLKRSINYDIDVSIPAGLLILKKPTGNESGITNFGGVSLAMIAQMSFYHPGRIAKYRPYKLGGGFMAIDALNFSERSKRDVAFVILGSIYPTTSGNKLSFPLYAGFGYLFEDSEPFFLLGPGIRVRL